jgi:hypothetical protein
MSKLGLGDNKENTLQRRLIDIDDRLAALEKRVDGLQSIAFQHDIKIYDISFEPVEPNDPILSQKDKDE